MAKQGVAHLSDKQLAFLSESVLPEADYLLRFAIGALGLSANEALTKIQEIFRHLAADIQGWSTQKDPNIRLDMISKLIASQRQQLKDQPASDLFKKMLPDLASMDVWQRQAFVAIDLLGISVNDYSQHSQRNGHEDLLIARQSLAGEAKAQGGTGDFWLNIYQSPDQNSEASLEDEQNLVAAAPEDQVRQMMIEKRGQLQVSLQQFRLSPQQAEELLSCVESADFRVTLELAQIQEAERSEFNSSLKRRLSIVAVVAVSAFFLAYFFWRAPQPKTIHFDPVKHLALETLAMIEDPTGRLDYTFQNEDSNSEIEGSTPQESVAEVKEYLSNHPRVDFAFSLPHALNQNWMVIGASVFDYGDRQIAVVRYQAAGAGEVPMVVFGFKGSLERLGGPEQTIGQSGVSQDGKLRFMSFGSDQLNMVFWQVDRGTLSAAVSTRSVSDIVSFIEKFSTVQPLKR